MLDILDEPAVETKPVSFARQIASLKTGESAAKVKRLDIGSGDAADINGFMKLFRSSVDAQVSKERRAAFKDFAVEQGTIITTNGALLAVVAVTRL